jgi:serine/threonine protein kinase
MPRTMSTPPPTPQPSGTPALTVQPTATPLPTTQVTSQPAQESELRIPVADLITALEQNGYDVKAVKQLLANGDSAAVQSWLAEFRTAHPGVIERIEQDQLSGKKSTPSVTPSRSTATGGIPYTLIGGIVALVLMIAGVYGVYRWKRQGGVTPAAPNQSLATATSVRTTLHQDIQHSHAPLQLPPELAEKYPDAEFVGKGGFAAVYKATGKDGNAVAIKVPLVLNASTGKTFIAELQNWTKLSHPNIVRVYDYNIMPVPYFEMEYCESSLADIARPMRSAEAEWLIFNVCEGLKFTHSLGLIHRDLKPENILLKNDIPKISDWGLSRAVSLSVSTATTAYTPSYAAPEQINNQQKDERTDVWQLGVILYELVTGETPFKGDTFLDVITSILTREPEPSGSFNPDAEDLEPIIKKCLRKTPSDRYLSVAELQKALMKNINARYRPILEAWKGEGDIFQATFFYGDLLLMNLKSGNIRESVRLATDISRYVNGAGKQEMEAVLSRLNRCLNEGETEVPDTLMRDAEQAVRTIRSNQGPDSR